MSQYVYFPTTRYAKSSMSTGCHDTARELSQYVLHLLRFMIQILKQVDTLLSHKAMGAEELSELKS